jgi:hypothetical protein
MWVPRNERLLTRPGFAFSTGGRSMKRFAITAAMVVALLSANAAANAEEHARAALDYAMPKDLAGCPDRDAFVSEVATRLGYDPFAGEDAPPKTLIVRYKKDGARAVADLRLEATKKNITSETGACSELGSAAAFAAAIMLDPRAMFPKPAAKTTPSGEPLDSHSPGTWPWYEPPPLPEQPKPKPEPPTDPLRVHAGLSLLGCVGCAPSVNAGGSVFFGLAKGRFGIDVGARGDLPASAQASSGREVSSALVVGELFPHARFGPLRPGILGDVGALFGDSEGQRQVSTWAAAGARVGLELPSNSMFFVRANVDGLFVLSRVSLRVDGRELWSTPVLVAAFGLGAGLRF